MPRMLTNPNNRRSVILEAMQTGQPAGNFFLPLCFYDYFHELPGYSELCSEVHAKTDAAGHTCEELEYRTQFYNSVGVAFLDWCCGRGFRTEYDSSVKTTSVTEDRRITTTHETPIGSLRTVSEHWPELNAGYVIEPLLKTEDDTSIYRFMIESQAVVRTFEEGSQWLSIIGEGGVAPHPGCGIPFHHVLYLYGPELFLSTMVTDMPSSVRELMDLLHKRNLEYCAVLAESPFQLIDYESSWDIGILSPDLMREFYVPYMKEYTDILHASGKVCMDHVSGENITPFVDEIQASGLDFLYGVEVNADNMVERHRQVQQLQGNTVLCAGVDPVFMWQNSADAVRELCLRISDTFGDTKSAFGSADAVVAGTPAETLATAAETLCCSG